MNATPARTKKAKQAMAEVESYIRELVHQLRTDGILDQHAEIAALADEAKARVEALRKARINL
jgi:hypothetical protein